MKIKIVQMLLNNLYMYKNVFPQSNILVLTLSTMRRCKVADIYKTSVCPLAKVMRKELKARNIKELKVVYSKEESVKIAGDSAEKRSPASISFVPSVAGLIIAGEVVKDLIK